MTYTHRMCFRDLHHHHLTAHPLSCWTHFYQCISSNFWVFSSCLFCDPLGLITVASWTRAGLIHRSKGYLVATPLKKMSSSPRSHWLPIKPQTEAEHHASVQEHLPPSVVRCWQVLSYEYPGAVTAAAGCSCVQKACHVLTIMLCSTTHILQCFHSFHVKSFLGEKLVSPLHC